MIRGPRGMAIAVRAPDGRIVTNTEVTESAYTSSLRKIPLVRGIVTLYETFSLGIRSLHWSSQIASGRGDGSGKASAGDIAISVGALTIAAATFFVGPVLLTGWVSRVTGSGEAEVLSEGALRIGMLLGYIWFIGRLPEVQRVFAYHGAEHRTIHAHEHGLPLTIENVRTFPNAHPRCGTAFLLTVGVLSFVAFSVLGTPPVLIRILERVILTPVIAGVAYEFLRASQSLENHPIFRFAQYPNLWLQKMTTRDPDDAQIEVAIASLNAVLALEAALPAVGAASALVPVAIEIDADDRSV